MKKTIVLIAFFTLITMQCVQAQSELDYFVGKWKAEATVGIEEKVDIIIELSRPKKKLSGFIIYENQKPSEITKVVERNDSVKIYFYYKLVRVIIVLKKATKDHCNGILMSKYQIECIRTP